MLAHACALKARNGSKADIPGSWTNVRFRKIEGSFERPLCRKADVGNHDIFTILE